MLFESTGRDWPLPTPCECGETRGEIRPKAGHNCLYCVGCDRYVKNVAKADTGEAPRSVSTRVDIKPAQRERIIERDAGRCMLCGRPAGQVILHIGHVLSVEEGRALGATDEELYDDENLLALCEECNLGMGRRSVSPRLALRLIRAAMMRTDRRKGRAA